MERNASFESTANHPRRRRRRRMAVVVDDWINYDYCYLDY
jgi:hypothetical protein